MKKIIAIVAMAACAAGIASAVEVKSKVYMAGNLASGDKDGAKILTLNDTDQTDDGALVFEISGEKAGAKFAINYNYNGSNDKGVVSVDKASTVKDVDWEGKDVYNTSVSLKSNQIAAFNSVSLWLKPIDMLKISVGNVGIYGYTERIHWWKTPVAESYNNQDDQWYQWSNQTGIEDKGLVLELTPISGLTIDAGVALNDDWLTIVKDGDTTVAPWGAQVKYQILDKVSALVSWRDHGATFPNEGDAEQERKILTVGVDFGNWGTPYYGFVSPRFLFSRYTGHNAWDGARYGDLKLRGISIDNYVKYATGPLSIQGRFPVTIRLPDSDYKDEDPSYLIWEIRADYSMGAYTPYVAVSNDDDTTDGYYPLTFGKDDLSAGKNMVVGVKAGVAFKLGDCSIDGGVKIWGGSSQGADKFGWAIPVEMTVNF